MADIIIIITVFDAVIIAYPISLHWSGEKKVGVSCGSRTREGGCIPENVSPPRSRPQHIQPVPSAPTSPPVGVEVTKAVLASSERSLMLLEGAKA